MSDDKELLLDEAEDTQHGRFLTFALGSEVYGIEIRHVTEIIGMQRITKLPEVPDYVKGIINLRGKIIQVVDIRLKFKLAPIEYSDRTCIIVINTGEIAAGLIVDNVSEVMSIEDENILPPPDIKNSALNRYLCGIGRVGDEVKLLLNCEKLFMEEEVEEMKNVLEGISKGQNQ